MARPSFLTLSVICGLLACPLAQAVDLSLKQPAWAELPAQQKKILAPLATDWDGFASTGRKKWLTIAERFPAMTPEEQERLQGRMQIWASLSVEDRKLARENFKSLKRIPPEQRKALREKWEEYNNLPAEEKLRLQALAKQKSQHRPLAGKRTPTSAHTKPVTKSLNASAARGATESPTVAITPPILPLMPLMTINPSPIPTATTAAAAPSSAPATTTTR